MTKLRGRGHGHRRLLRRRRHLGERLPLRAQLRRRVADPDRVLLPEQPATPSRSPTRSRPPRRPSPRRPPPTDARGAGRRDGPFAVYLATRQAVRRARKGEGPTLIEAVCYRYGAHATADDARLYRSPDEEQKWRRRDPIDRLRPSSRERDEWDRRTEEKIAQEAADESTPRSQPSRQSPSPGATTSIRHGFPGSRPTRRAAARDAARSRRGADRVP